MIGIVICYAIGTRPILKTCLDSIARHMPQSPFHIYLLHQNDKPFDADDLLKDFDTSILSKHSLYLKEQPDVPRKSSNIHGRMLDIFCPTLQDEFLLTLDSDCFPVADDWLDLLVDEMDNGAGTAGILYPYAPPPSSLNMSSVETRVRTQHCWNTTHVACQMMRMCDYKRLSANRNGILFNAGDDTGLIIPALLKSEGKKCQGFRLTRGPLSKNPDVNPEFNRYVSLIFGDKMFHMGGYTRETILGDDRVMDDAFGYAQDRTISNGGAEWLLCDTTSYQYTFKQEEDVAKDKMNRLFGMKKK